MKTFVLTCFILVHSLLVISQTKIAGTIKATDGLPIANANISLKATYDGTSSDSSGNFSFTAAGKGKHLLLFSAVNYKSDSMEVDLNSASLQLELTLRSQLYELDAVVITAGTFEASDSKKGVVLNSLDVATTAGATADIFAALQTLPGTQTSFSESGLFVRGGSAAETKTYFDGMLVKNPFNSRVPDQASRGRFSPFLFKGTSFSSGGYSAQYGQALSSALVLESKDLPEKTTTGLSLLSVGGGIDQNIRFDNSALSLGGFYYNLKPAFAVIRQHADWEKEPEQFGATLQYKLKTSKTGLLKWYSDFSHTQLGLYNTDPEAPSAKKYFGNTNKNTYINTSYQEYFGNEWKLQGGLSFSNTADEGLQGADRYQRRDQVFQARITATNYFGNLSNVKFGGETYSFDRGESMKGHSRGYTDHLTAAFAETEVYLSPALVARLGIRGEYSSYLKTYNVAPRTSLGYKTGKNSQISMAYGRFYQNPDDEYMPLQPLDFEQADHYILNFQRSNSDYTFRAEAYYKDYNKLVKTSGALPVNTGDGYARGLDIFWRDKKSIEGVDYWISYSFLDTKRNAGDYPVASVPPFAAKHTLNIVYKQFFEKLKSQVGATYTYGSGRTYVNPNNPVYLADKTSSYHNFSMNISYLTHIFKQFTVLYISANNIPGFKQVYGYNYSSDGKYRQAIRPGASRDVFVGLLLTIGDDTFVR